MAISNDGLALAVAERMIEDLQNELNDTNEELSDWREKFWDMADRYAVIINKLGEIVEGAVE